MCSNNVVSLPLPLCCCYIIIIGYAFILLIVFSGKTPTVLRVM